MALVHEERPIRARVLVEDTGFAEAASAIAAVLTGFGEVWRADSDDELFEYSRTRAGRPLP